MEIEGAVLQRASLRVVAERWRASGGRPRSLGAWTLADIPVAALRLRDIVWIDRRDIALAYDADVAFDTGWRPREAELRRPGVAPAAPCCASSARATEDRWRTRIDVGGGTLNGERHAADPRQRPAAPHGPAGAERRRRRGAGARFGRRSAVEGQLHGETTVRAEGDNVTDLVRSLHTRTRFTVQPATLTGLRSLPGGQHAPAPRRGDQTVLDDAHRHARHPGHRRTAWRCATREPQGALRRAHRERQRHRLQPPARG